MHLHCFYVCNLYYCYSLARGTLNAETAGIVSGLSSQAENLKIGTGADDRPTVVVEFDTGWV